jgi:CDP-diacylglycerol--glycerol-3-phosphate 3-phosphatidyltransferase
MLDLACSLLVLGLSSSASLAYGVRFAARGPFGSARVEREGRSLLLGRRAMEAFHWVLDPIAAGCARLGITANAITFGSVGLAVIAGVLIATGHAGTAGMVAALAASGDGLDGMVARRTHRASAAGGVFDSAADRYSELAFLGGIAVALRTSAPLLLLALLAILASFMVSYSTAKAEALHVQVPRGSMRRTERAVYLVLGAALAPLAARLDPRFYQAPIVAALALVAVVGNFSALRRLAAVAAGARARMDSDERRPSVP